MARPPVTTCVSVIRTWWSTSALRDHVVRIGGTRHGRPRDSFNIPVVVDSSIRALFECVCITPCAGLNILEQGALVWHSLSCSSTPLASVSTDARLFSSYDGVDGVARVLSPAVTCVYLTDMLRLSQADACRFVPSPHRVITSIPSE